MTSADEPAFDPSILISAISAFLLGEQPTLTSAEVSERSGVSMDAARERWRTLGFPDVDDEAVAFTDADVEALQFTQKLMDLGVVNPDTAPAFIRTVGRTFARLAEWQARAVLNSILAPADGDGISLDRLEEIVPLGEQVQSYVWRRHLLGAASRLLLRETTTSEGSQLCVGFADIVGYTTRSRRMSTHDLAAMVERFEEVVTGLITDHGGQVIKTIGDEVLFVADSPRECSLLALELLEQHLADETFPEVRVGMAYGHVLNRLGDVFGPVVNVASRLTSIAKPGRAVMDRSMADHLHDDDTFRIRRMRRTSVKGYEHLEPWSLKRPREGDDRRPDLRETIEEVIEDVADGVSLIPPRRDRHSGSGKPRSRIVKRPHEEHDQ